MGISVDFESGRLLQVLDLSSSNPERYSLNTGIHFVYSPSLDPTRYFYNTTAVWDYF
jgi:hypothetical protein